MTIEDLVDRINDHKEVNGWVPRIVTLSPGDYSMILSEARTRKPSSVLGLGSSVFSLTTVAGTVIIAMKTMSLDWSDQ